MTKWHMLTRNPNVNYKLNFGQIMSFVLPKCCISYNKPTLAVYIISTAVVDPHRLEL